MDYNLQKQFIGLLEKPEKCDILVDLRGVEPLTFAM